MASCALLCQPWQLKSNLEPNLSPFCNKTCIAQHDLAIDLTVCSDGPLIHNYINQSSHASNDASTDDVLLKFIDRYFNLDRLYYTATWAHLAAPFIFLDTSTFPSKVVGKGRHQIRFRSNKQLCLYLHLHLSHGS